MSAHRAPGFSVKHGDEPGDVLVAGFSNFGLAGLTAVDYAVDHLGLEATGHVESEGLPSITPFEEGRPRHPIRLFSGGDVDATVLVGELPLPAVVGDAFAGSLLDWTAATGVSEIVVLLGVPIAHGPDDHRSFYVATDGYRERRLADAAVTPMGSGYLDGVTAGILEGGIESALDVCVYVTPVHAQAPDAEAAIRLVETLESVYGFGIDSGPLREFAAEIARHYEQLAERMEDRKEELPEDRMYM